MNGNSVLHSYTVVDNNRIIRLDGPAINTVPSSMLTSNTSTTQIYNGTAKSTMVFAPHVVVNFNKFRISKTGTGSESTDYITLRELQIWINNTNVATSFTTIDTNDPKENQTRQPNNFINDVIDDTHDGLWHSTRIGNNPTNEIYATYSTTNTYSSSDLQLYSIT